jgi:pentatricopeptide repeat protein
MSGGAATIRGLLVAGGPLSPLNIQLLHARLDLHHTDLPALRFHSILPDPSRLTFPFALKAASRLPNNNNPLFAGVKLHARSLKLPSHSNRHVLTSLLSLYAKCGLLHDAQRVFDEIPRPSTVSWTALITAYMDAGRVQDAVSIAGNAFASGVRPDSLTVVKVLTA